jgi:acyl-CoA reductase-like NAD-dependent aldehyde dehydrogenase
MSNPLVLVKQIIVINKLYKYKGVSMLQTEEKKLHSEIDDGYVDALVERAVAAQRAFQTWPEEATDRLLQAIAKGVYEHAEELAIAAVQETGMGNVKDKTAKNRFASLDIYRSLKGRVGHGLLGYDRWHKIMTFASPMGVVLGLVPATHPAATFIFKVLIALKGRNALILSPSQRAIGVSNQVGELIRQVLYEHGAPLDLVQWVSAKKSRTTVGALMVHPGISFILATGGPGLVKAAYQSGKPAIGVGSGNAPVLVCADADLSLAARNIVMSKAFDNGLACCSENNLIVVESRMKAFTAALEEHGAAVLSAEETQRLLAVIVDPGINRLHASINGQAASTLAGWASIRRSYAIQVLVLPIHEVSEHNALAREKLAPLLSLFSVVDEQAGMRMCEQILALEGTGHTAIIYTHMPRLTTEFGARMPASRILVNTPGVQGGMGLETGLQPSMTLGCGTFGGTSTTDNVTYTHLLNMKRVAYSIPSRRGQILRKLKEIVTTFFSYK